MQRLVQNPENGYSLLPAAFSLAGSQSQARQTAAIEAVPTVDMSLVDRPMLLGDSGFGDLLAVALVVGVVGAGYLKWSRDTESGNLFLLKRRPSRKIYDDTRRNAIRYLKEHGSPRTVKKIIRLLADRRSRVREAAAEALGELNDRRAVEPLIGRLGDNERWVRYYAVMALEKLGDLRALEPLIGRLGDNDNGVRKVAAEALGELNDRRAVEPLIGRLGDNERWVRCYAVMALEKLGDLRAIWPLEELLRHTPPTVTREERISDIPGYRGVPFEFPTTVEPNFDTITVTESNNEYTAIESALKALRTRGQAKP